MSCETLFFPMTSGRLKPEGRILFLNAAPCEGISTLDKKSLVLQQYYKPLAAALQAEGYSVASEIPAKGDFDFVFLHAPKNITETKYMIARAGTLLKAGGVLVAGAANDAGGSRLEGLLESGGFSRVQKDSKNKAKVVWGSKEQLEEKTSDEWIASGKMQDILDGRYISMPGIFSWDEIDSGSDILTRFLPKDLKGAGADFGCGYGYLADFVLQHCPGVENFSCLDADYRAIECARHNLKKHDRPVRYFWEDLTFPPALSGLDFIVMNPPFHEGKKTDPGLGKSFISSAFTALRPGGVLWMVANAGLAYEGALKNFSKAEKKFEGEGFKIFRASK